MRHQPSSSPRTGLGLFRALACRALAWQAWRADGVAERAFALTLDPIQIFRHPRDAAAEHGEVARRDTLLRFVGDGPRYSQQLAAQPLGLRGEEDPHLAAVVV